MSLSQSFLDPAWDHHMYYDPKALKCGNMTAWYAYPWTTRRTESGRRRVSWYRVVYVMFESLFRTVSSYTNVWVSVQSSFILYKCLSICSDHCNIRQVIHGFWWHNTKLNHFWGSLERWNFRERFSHNYIKVQI